MFRRNNIFIRNKKPLAIKIQSVIDYILGLSYRKIKQKLEFLHGIKVAISAIFKWVKSFQSKIKVSVEKRKRNQIAIDETVVKSRDRKLYLWSAIDLENKELVAFDVSVGRSSLDAMMFLYKIKGMGFNYMYNTFSVRNPIERFFGLVKDRQEYSTTI